MPENIVPPAVAHEPTASPRTRSGTVDDASTTRDPRAPTIGLVLAGGGARGAYEVGVLRYLREAMTIDTRFDVISGSSVGAVNGAFLAATCERPRSQVTQLARIWSDLNVDALYPVGFRQLRELPAALFGGRLGARIGDGAAVGGLVDARGFFDVLETRIPWRGIAENLQRGHLRAFACTATEVATGLSTIFVQAASGRVDFTPADDEVAVHTSIQTAHVLASAAIPGLMPAIRVGEQFYVDGSLRQNTPLRPAMRLGANRLLVIGLEERESASVVRARQRGAAALQYPSALHMFGKVLAAWSSDKVEEDLVRVRRMNELLAAGTRAYGPTFAATMAEQMGRSRPYEPIEVLTIAPSTSLGQLAADVVRRGGLARARGWMARAIRRTVAADVAGVGSGDSEFSSYVLFDPGYVHALFELGYADARAHHDALIHLFRADSEP